MGMQLTILGSGDAAGIPRPDCTDPNCACARARLGTGPRRANTCALIEAGAARIAIDTGCGQQDCTALLLTHYHSDHADRRAEFPVRAWGPADGVGRGNCGHGDSERFPKPERVRRVKPFATVRIGAALCTALPLNHPVPVNGWVIEAEGRRLAWLTDSYGIPASSLAWLAAHPCDVLCLDTTFAPGVARAPLKGHGEVGTSLAAIAASGAAKALLIHIGHGLQNWLDAGGEFQLPTHVSVAEDGVTFVL